MSDQQQETDAFEDIPSEIEDQEVGIPVYRIRSYPSDPDLETLYARWQRKEIIMPEFQRGYVWKHSQASKLIESFLIGLPVPGVFVFVEEETEQQLVIDGQQRLRSIFGFFEGTLPNVNVFSLAGVDPRWEGMRFTDLNGTDRRKLEHSVLRVVNIEPLTSDDHSSVYQIFERLNTGGTSLTPQEVRNSSFHGPFNDALGKANTSPSWRSLFGNNNPDARMRDVELIVRFLALYESADSYQKPMKKFLTDYMATHQWDPEPERIQQRFIECADRVYCQLGARPFHVRSGLNAAVFDSVMVAFASCDRTPEDIQPRYESLKTNEKYVASTTTATTDVDTVKRRIELATEILFG
jgi:hypothetical protein